MKDAVQRIVKNGNSSLLLDLAKRVGNAGPIDKTTESTNLVGVTVVRQVSPIGGGKGMAVKSAEEWNALPSDVKRIVVNGCDDYKREVLDLSRFAELEELTIGDGCFNYVSKVSVVGLKKLKSVEIGEKSFQNESADSQLVVSDCPELASLRIGNQSFKEFKRFNLSEVDGLKSVMIGDGCFKECDLVLRELKSVESVCVGSGSFEKSRHTVVESLIS